MDSTQQTRFTALRKYYQRRMIPFTKSNHTNAYMMVILSLFTISFFGIFAIRPTVKTIVELNRQISDAKVVNESLQKKIDALVVAQEEYQLVKNFVPAINEALPNQPNLTAVVGKLESLVTEKEATIAGLTINTITYKETVDPELPPQETSTPVVPINIALQLNGSFDQFSSFIERVLTMRRTVTADSLDLSSSQEEQTSKLNLSINLSTYYLKK